MHNVEKGKAQDDTLLFVKHLLIVVCCWRHFNDRFSTLLSRMVDEQIFRKEKIHEVADIRGEVSLFVHKQTRRVGLRSECTFCCLK